MVALLGYFPLLYSTRKVVIKVTQLELNILAMAFRHSSDDWWKDNWEKIIEDLPTILDTAGLDLTVIDHTTKAPRTNSYDELPENDVELVDDYRMRGNHVKCKGDCPLCNPNQRD